MTALGNILILYKNQSAKFPKRVILIHLISKTPGLLYQSIKLKHRALAN